MVTKVLTGMIHECWCLLEHLLLFYTCQYWIYSAWTRHLNEEVILIPLLLSPSCLWAAMFLLHIPIYLSSPFSSLLRFRFFYPRAFYRSPLGCPSDTHTQPAPNWTYSFPLNLLPFQCPLLTQQLHIPSIQSFTTEIWGAILDPDPPPPTQYPPADLMKIPGTPLLSTSMASMPTVFFIRSTNIYWPPPGCHALG